MHNPRMRSIVLISSGVIGIGVMILLAVALAQRDSRQENKLAHQAAGSIQPKKAQGIPMDPEWEEYAWPPAPIVRGNDSPLGSHSGTARDRNNPFRSPAAALTAFSNQQRSGSLAEPPPLQYRPLPTGGLSGGPGLDSSPASLPSLPQNDLSSELPSANRPNSLMPAPPNSLRSTEEENDDDELPSLPTLGSPSAAPPRASLSDMQQLPSSSPFQGNNLRPANPAASNDLDDSLPDLPSAAILPTQTAPPAFSGSAPTPFPGSAAPVLPGPMPVPQQNTLQTNAPQTNAPAPLPDQPPAAVRMQPPRLEDLSPSEPASPSNSGFPSSGSPAASATASPQAFGEVRTAGPFKAFTSPSPGVRQLEGSQNPNIEIQKRAPAEVQVGLPATITLLVRNVGNATAFDVRVSDSVPQGAKLTRTTPEAKSDGQGNLIWELGQFKAGAEQVLTMEIVPETEGELGSVASVQFAAQASVRTMSTLPKLHVKQTSASSVLGGDSEVIKIEVANHGTGTARNVRLEAELPSNMRHASGSTALDTDGIDLAPGDSFQMELELTAVTAGAATSRIKAVSDNAAPFESVASIDVIQPKLELGIEGPRLRYLERQATYKVQVQNTGNAMAKGIRLVVYLPRGLQFNSAANDGTYFPEQHSVEWYLEELNAGRSATTELSVLPVQEGDFVLRMHGTAARVRADAIDKKVQVEGQSELYFSIADDNDPIERDGLTTYIVKVSNSGARPDSDVSLIVELPEGASVEQVHAPVDYRVEGRTVVFAPIANLQPRAQQTYRLSVRHTREGLLLTRAQLKSRNRPVAVSKEESTEVYIDQ
ncbi:hypothetical protein SH449x_002306 [Pirellulaceae bacterium SH449]